MTFTWQGGVILAMLFIQLIAGIYKFGKLEALTEALSEQVRQLTLRLDGHITLEIKR